MDKKIITNICLMVIVLFLSNCATLASKYPDYFTMGEKVTQQKGNPYSGIELLMGNWKCFFKDFPFSIITHNILIPFMIIEIPLTIVADTLFLPYDLAKDSPGPRPKMSCEWHI